MSSECIRFPFRCVIPATRSRPIVSLRIRNAHVPEHPGMLVLGLIDTGADVTVVPRAVADMIGHAFESGRKEQPIAGVGSTKIGRTFVHRCQIDPLAPPEHAGVKLEPFVSEARIVEGDMEFVLLGQSDFLKHYAYRQNGQEQWFELEPLRQ